MKKNILFETFVFIRISRSRSIVRGGTRVTEGDPGGTCEEVDPGEKEDGTFGG